MSNSPLRHPSLPGASFSLAFSLYPAYQERLDSKLRVLLQKSKGIILPDEVFQRIPNPEIFIGIVAPIGTNLEDTVKSLTNHLKAHDYDVCHIKVTATFDALKEAIPKLPKLELTDKYKKYDSFIRFGDHVRKHFVDDAILASLAMGIIAQERARIIKKRQDDSQNKGVCQKVAYIINQFKRREETDRMRSVYEKLFFQISVYSSRPNRVDNLSKVIASSNFSGAPNEFRDLAEKLVKTDENDSGNKHGQKVSDVFHDADAILVTDDPEISIEGQVNRVISLLFGCNRFSPTKVEYGMYAAKSASIRSLDLSRQVGAATFTSKGEIISLGANEVPKAGGGTYWCDDGLDARDYTKKEDWNLKRKIEILSELIGKLMPDASIAQIIQSDIVSESQFMDALEYGRMIHAEMSAISDAARRGLSLAGAILYCTTFPCHLCAKHIVAAGLERVVFLEPYPKSLANELNGDSLMIEGQYRGEYSAFPAVKFQHFYGISPRRYREMFERKRRKDDSGHFTEWKTGKPQIIVDIFIPNYLKNEFVVVSLAERAIVHAGANPRSLFKRVAVPDVKASEHYAADNPPTRGTRRPAARRRSPPGS